MKNALQVRVERRLKDLGFGPVEAAARVPELERNFIRDLVEGKKRSFSQEKASLVARALNWTLDELNGIARPRQMETGGATLWIPVIDYVSAGGLCAPSSQIPTDDLPLVAASDLGPGEFFALKVMGDSIDRIAPENALVIVNRADRTLVADNPFVFLIDGETTTKLWQPARENSPAYLAPHSYNPGNKPIFFKRRRDVEVVGRIKRVIIDL